MTPTAAAPFEHLGATLTGPVEFAVEGIPAPQGSKTPLGGGRMREASEALSAWRALVTFTAARVAARCDIETPFDGPLLGAAVFRFPMPKGRPAAVRRAGIAPKTTFPDLDKLQRSVGDALTDAQLITDDARIVEWAAVKYETTGWTGAVIRLDRWHPPVNQGAPQP